MEVPYHGESYCSVIKKDGKSCSNKAYYSITDTNVYACGVHSKPANRTVLEENPKKAEIIKERIENAQTDAELYALRNKQEGKRGDIIVSKLKVMKTPEQVKGYLLIFPNHSDKNRIIGLGMPELSPMNIIISHGQPDLPPTSLENFHQGNKCYLSESVNGEPSVIFFENQKKMYEDDTPHRHKVLSWLSPEEKLALKEEAKQEKVRLKEEKIKLKQENGKKNKQVKGNKIEKIPKEKDSVLYSIVWKDGVMMKLSYADTRKLYCEFYENAIKDLPEYHKLCGLLLDGFNLQICGYDGYEITDTILNHYNDLNKPFGHELTLYSMLMNYKDANINLPWR